MLRIFVRHLFCRPFILSPIQSCELKNIIVTSLHFRYCTNVNVHAENGLTDEETKSIKRLKAMFKCTDEQAKDIYHQIEPFDSTALRKFSILTQNGATLPTLMEHSYLLKMPNLDFLQNLKLLKYLPWKATDDFIPFLGVKRSKLKPAKIRDLADRVYYLSEKLKIDPPTVSKYMSKHSYMWEMEFDVIKSKLQLLEEHGQYLSPINILRDLDIFRRKKEVILERLNRIESTTVVKKAMPWMVKCPEPTLNRTIQLQMHRGELINYLAKRLDWSRYMTNKVQKEFPKLKNYNQSLNNVEEVLNILLPKFGAKAITNNIHIVTMPLKEIIKRCSKVHASEAPLNEATLMHICAPQSKFYEYLRKYDVRWKKMSSS